MSEPGSQSADSVLHYVTWCLKCDAVHSGSQPADRCPACGTPLTQPTRGAAELHAAYADYLRKVVRLLAAKWGAGDNWTDTEDVVQDTLLTLFWTPGPVMKPKPWLVKVASHKVAKAIMSQHSVIEGDFAGPGDAGAPRWSSAARVAGIGDAQLEQSVMAGIRALPKKQRIATYLDLIEGWSREEIAAYAGIAVSTARVEAWHGAKLVRDSIDWTPVLLPFAFLAKYFAALRRKMRPTSNSPAAASPGSALQGLAGSTAVHVMAGLILVGAITYGAVAATRAPSPHPAPGVQAGVVHAPAAGAPVPRPGVLPASPPPSPAKKHPSPPPGSPSPSPSTATSASASPSQGTSSSSPPVSPSPTRVTVSSSPTQPPAAQVPDCSEMTPANCENLLASTGFGYRIQSAGASTPPGTLTGQSPAGSSWAAPGTTVTLYVTDVMVPACVGRSVADCMNALQAVGFNVTTQTGDAASPSLAPGTVDLTEPTSTLAQTYGTSVTVYVVGVLVPDCTGLALSDCEGQLAQAGLNYSEQPQPGLSQPVGNVDYTDPAANTWVADGSTVTVTYTAPCC